ncbi:uncharacterized protein IUM83_09376 [Phytophthora cinnamomi]|uniref:uncharacterized protein n=1 Tax=Phytophthora cinnamomi TaxID=4785 RepID=UPI00355AC3E7|nr:hypothetical protein IUM83_09376 [Phytophthora cinnamomi]
MWRQDGSAMERAARSPQSRHRKRRLLEATQHASPPSERALVEGLAAQVAAGRLADDAEAVNACVRVLRNAKNCVYLRALAARALGLLMLESRALADRLRLETEGLVDALLQVVGYCRRSRTQTADTRRVHVNCCLVISLLMQEPWQQQHLQLVVSLDSELLVLQPQPAERESANLLLTVAGRPESERKKEQEALDAWLEEEAKAHRMRLLYNILRYPYVEEWEDETQSCKYTYNFWTTKSKLTATKKTSGYQDLIIWEQLPEVARSGLAGYADMPLLNGIFEELLTNR